jgi:hypothetical protein
MTLITSIDLEHTNICQVIAFVIYGHLETVGLS